MSKIYVRQVQKVFRDLFQNLIDTSGANDEKKKEDYFYTRSQAAYAVKLLSNATVEDAVTSVTDGFNDGGIDAIYIDNESRQLIIVQSKWVYEGQKSPELGDILKFIDGFHSLMDAKFDVFNNKINSMKNEIERVLDDPSYTYVVTVIYTGTQPISSHVEDKLNDLKKSYNEISELLKIEIIDLKRLYKAISHSEQGVPINLEVNVNEYGKLSSPYKALYGRVNAEDIYLWYQEYEEGLFEKNLRKFISDSSLNDTIQKTLVDNPENFWYFNNGITILCSKITHKGKNAKNRDAGCFHLEGISVINGAQTVGNIYRAKEKGANLSEASVLVRFISLEDCEDDIFSNDITRATNSQNRIANKDFATLDHVQERLYRELKLDGKKYAYKTGDKIYENDDGFTFESAAIALACASNNIGYSTIAKSSVGKLWEDVNKPPYTLLFNTKTTSLRVWRSVEILFLVEEMLKSLQDWDDSKPETYLGDKRLATYCNRFILHIVFQMIPLDKFDNPDLDFNAVKKQAKDEFKVTFKLLKSTMNEMFQGAHLHYLFRNNTKCSLLKDKIISNRRNYTLVNGEVACTTK